MLKSLNSYLERLFSIESLCLRLLIRCRMARRHQLPALRRPLILFQECNEGVTSLSISIHLVTTAVSLWLDDAFFAASIDSL